MAARARAAVKTWSGRDVLFVSSSYPFHRRDYHARFVHEMAARVVQLGARVRVITPLTADSDREVEVWDGVEVERVRYALGPGVTGRDGIWENLRAHPMSAVWIPPLMLALARAIRRALGTRRPDLVVAHWLIPSGILVRSIVRGVPCAYVAHGTDASLVRPRVVRWLEAGGDVFATSRRLAGRLPRAALLPLGVEDPGALSPKTFDGPLRFAAMGRLVPCKDTIALLDVVGKIKEASLTIAGTGRLAETIEETIRRRRLHPRVRLIAPVLGEEKRAFFDAHDVFLSLGTAADNLPVSAAEAMAHGLPLVTNGNAATKELIERGGGIMLEDLASTTSADWRRLSLRAREAVSDRTGWACLDALHAVQERSPRLVA